MENKVDEILKVLSNNKIKNVEILDLTSKSPLMSKIIVGTFSNDKNTRVVANQVKQELEKSLEIEISMEGEFPGDWIILDLEDCAVELFTEEKRNYYNLEKLWGDNKNKLAKIKLKKRKKA